jgi:predicted dehydrogenase
VTPRIGLIGCGNWGRLILRDLLASGAEVHVASPTPVSRDRALALGACSASSDLSELGPVDGFVVATPTSTHAEVLDRLLPLGPPIFVEKPMTADVASARRLAAAGEGRIFVMDKWRYHPGVEAMRVEIASGRAGEVIAIRTERWAWGHPHLNVTPLWILAPHDLSIAFHLLGDLPPLRSALPLSARDTDLGLTAHFGAPGGPSVTLDIGIASHDRRRRCHVIASRATLELRDGYDQRIFVRDGAPGATGASDRIVEVGGKMPLLAELEHFLAYLRGGPPPMSTAREGLLIVERVAAIEAAIAATSVSAA